MGCVEGAEHYKEVVVQSSVKSQPVTKGFVKGFTTLMSILSPSDHHSVQRSTETKDVQREIYTHEERVKPRIAVEVYVRLHAPVVFVFLQQRVAKEEPRVEATHVAISESLTSACQV